MITILFLSANPDQTAQTRHLIPIKKYNNEIINDTSPDQTAQTIQVIKECNEIIKKIRSGDGRKLFKLEQRHDICINDLIEELLNYNPQILHFAGHGSKKSALLFKNEDTRQLEEVPPYALSNLFKVWGKKINLVFLNACYSEKQARAIAEHVNCVIGMSGAIPDNTAIKFASAFYLSLGFNKSVQEAFDIAKNQLELLSMSGDQIPKLIVKEGIDPSKITAVTIGSNIKVEEGINVTTIIQEIKSFGLNFLPPDYFQLYKSSKEDFVDWQKDFVDWKKGFSFKLPNIMDGFHFQRIDIINEIIQKLDDNNGDHALLLLGKSGASKSTLLMDVMCRYFRNGYIVFYNFGEEEIKDVYDIENSLRDRLKDGNKILVAVDNVHDKRTAAIFSVIDSLRSYEEKKDNIHFILTGRQPEFDRFVDDRLGEIPSDRLRRSIRKLYPKLRYEIKNFEPEEIKEFIKKYKDEEEVKNSLIQKYDLKYEEYDKIFNDEEKLDNISSLIFRETKEGYPILVKFLLFRKGIFEDMRLRYDAYLSKDNNIMKLLTMLICAILELANVPITDNLLSDMKILTYIRELRNQTLIFSKTEKRWKTLHVKWDLELLTYLFSEEDQHLLEDRMEILKKAIQLLMTTIKNEMDQYLIIGSLYDITTIETEKKEKIPINIIEYLVTKGENPVINNLNDSYKYRLYNYFIGRNYYYLNQFKQALDLVNEALQISPNGTEAWYHKGVLLANLRKNEEAVECYDKVIKELDPNHISAWLNKGVALGTLGRYEEEIQCFDKIITKLDPEYISAWYNKGTVLRNLARYEEAIACYNEVIKLDPNDVDAWYGKSYALGYLGRYGEVIECYDKIIELDSKHVGAWYSKGLVLDNLGKNEEAIACYDKVIQINPENIDAWLSKGISLGKMDKFDESTKCYDKVIQINPENVDAWYNKGVSLGILHRYKEAIECYDNIIKLHPNDDLAWYGKLDCYEEVTKMLDPRNIDAWYGKCVVLGYLSRYEEAIECYNEVIKLDPKHVDAWHNKGVTLENLDKFEEAIKCYEKIKVLDPNNVDAWYNIGHAYFYLDKYEEAIEYFDKALAIDPNYIDALNYSNLAQEKLRNRNK
jgi:tetratricopeptide (TPR) repeat protein